MLPYGEPTDDWLSLDEERYLRPTEAIGRKTIIGGVEITQQSNKDLRDKTNREGLIENAAFKDLHSLVKATVRIIENEWSIDKDVIEDRRKRERKASPRPVLEKLSEEASTFAELLQGPLRLSREMEAAINEGRATSEMAVKLADSIGLVLEQVPKIKDSAAMSTDALESAADELEHERDLLLGLAGMGLAAERFTHEFARLTREAHQILRRLEGSLRNASGESIADLAALRAVIDALRNDIKSLGPMFYVRRSTKEKELSVMAAIENARILNASAFQDAHVELEVDCRSDFAVFMREGPLTQVFNNLFDNAAFWLSRKSEEHDRRLKVVVDGHAREILVTDNGPGVPRYRDRIFRPFFSMKSDGRGLGLYIVREILAERSAEIRLLDAGEHAEMFSTGASFLIRFPETQRSNA